MQTLPLLVAHGGYYNTRHAQHMLFSNIAASILNAFHFCGEANASNRKNKNCGYGDYEPRFPTKYEPHFKDSRFSTHSLIGFLAQCNTNSYSLNRCNAPQER